MIGVGNGNPTSHEPDVANQRKAFNGLVQVIVRTRRNQPGRARVVAVAGGLKASSVDLDLG